MGHTHHLLVHSQLKPERPPRVPSPVALPGHRLPSCLVLLSHIPFRVTRSPHHPGKAVCCVLRRPLWCQVEEKRGTCVASHTQHSGQHLPTDCFTLDGPRVGSGAPLRVLILISSQRCLLIPVTKLLCPGFTDRMLIHTPLPGARGSGGKAPHRIWGSPEQVPAGLRTQEPCTEPSLQSTSSPPVGQA